MAESKKLPIAVVISAVDNVTYKVMAINEKIKRITAPVGKVGKAFSALGEEAGLGKFAKALGNVGSTGKEFFSSLGDALVKVGAVGLAAGGAIFELAHSFGQAGDDIAMMSRRLGMTTDSYQELAYAAKKANVPQEQFNGAMEKFSKGIGEAAAGTGEAFVGFNALKISVRDSTGHIRKLDDLLPEVADKLGNVSNQNLRNAIAAKIFGREGAKLNDIFEDGAAGLEAMRKEAHKVGAVMSPQDIKLAQEFDDGMKSIGSTLLMVRNVIGAALAPVVLDLGKKLQDYILGHTDEIKQFAASFAEKLPGVLSEIGKLLSNVASAVWPLVQAFNWLSSLFGEVNVIAGALFAYFGGPVIVNLVKFASAIFRFLGPALRIAWIGFGLLADVVMGLIGALVALVGWPILIGAALIAVAVAVWKWWEPIKNGILSVWEKVSGFFGSKTEINGNLTTSQGPPSLGAPIGAMKTVDATAQQSSQKNENHVLVEFMNLPKGTQVQSKKDEGNLDFLYTGAAGTGS